MPMHKVLGRAASPTHVNGSLIRFRILEKLYESNSTVDELAGLIGTDNRRRVKDHIIALRGSA